MKPVKKFDVPKPAEMLVELWPAPKASYILSSLFGKPASPQVRRIVCIFDLLPVRILCGYDCKIPTIKKKKKTIINILFSAKDYS